MRTAIACLIVGVSALWPSTTQSPAAIRIDGDFRDWETVPIAIRDGGDAPSSVVDFGDVRTAADARHMFVHVTFSRPLNLATVYGTLFVVLDIDGDRKTGATAQGLEGADIVVECSRDPPSPMALPQTGIVVRRLPPPATGAATSFWSSINFQYAPRHAGEQFEWRLDRGASTTARLKLVFTAGGTVMDQTDETLINMPLLAGGPPMTRGTGDADPLARANSTSFRMAVWNVLGMAPFSAEAVARVIAAVDPDIIIVDEIWPALSADDVAARLPPASKYSRAPWQARVGGTSERHALAARAAIDVVQSQVQYPRELFNTGAAHHAEDYVRMLDRGVGASVVTVTIGGRRLLVAPLDLTSGGPPGSEPEALRVLEADAINRAVAAALARVRPDGILIGGDVNLVGTRDPLDILARGLDRNRTPLLPVEAYRLSDISKDTWRQPGGGGRFPPGRLDWLLHGSSSLEVLNSFVFDAEDLNARWLGHYKLQLLDSRASDHLPIVADFRWK